MTTVVAGGPTQILRAARPGSVVRPGLGHCLGRLSQAIDAGSAIGLDVTHAMAVLAEARERLGFPSGAYVLALVGGTGVGKSSVLNALAGNEVSRASARRPTTSVPLAWVAASAVDDVAPLVERLGVAEQRVHDGDALADVVILDLPDLDSIDPAHRARVEELLPRVDSVAWVIDPEKYADARLHDEFLHRWLARLDRQVLVLNKADRLRGDAAAEVAADLERSIRRDGDGRKPHVPILTVSAAEGATGVGPLRAWLESARDAKAIVAGRLGAAARDATLALAAAAGVDHEVPASSLLEPTARKQAMQEAIEATLQLVDLPGAERQAIAATRARARPAGAGPLGRITALIYRTSGRQRRVADPATYLAGWRSRGGLARPVEALRTAVAEATRAAVPAMRPHVAATGDSAALATRIARSVDRVLSARGDLPAPGSRLWPLIGLLQTVNTVALVVSVAWLVVWLIARPPVDSFDLPYVGVVPAPFALVVLTGIVGFVLARALSIHAGWVGRRWARKLRRELQRELSGALDQGAFASLDRIETERRALWVAARGSSEECS